MTTQMLNRERRPRRLLRERQLRDRLSLGRTKTLADYVLHDESDPYIPGTDIRRLLPVRMGPRCVAYDEAEVDALIDALVEHSRDAAQGGER